MIKATVLPIIFFLTFLVPGKSVGQQRTHPAIDFFSDQKKLPVKWIGPMEAGLGKKSIRNIALMQYFDKDKGTARIVCFPKVDLKKWQDASRSLTHQKQVEKVRAISLKKSEQEKYNIFAFFVPSKYLVEPKEEATFVGEKVESLPAVVYVYKRAGIKWQSVKTVKVKTWVQYSDLIYDTSVGVK